MNAKIRTFASLIKIAVRLIPAAILLLAMVVAVDSGCATDGRVLSGDEVRALFSGKTVKGYHEKKEYPFTSYYEPSGTFRSYQDGATVPRSGRWWVNDSGDICIQWKGEPQSFCRKMITNDKGDYWKVLVKSGGKRILIVTFESFVDGNVNNL